jgi:hypothetical protein
MMMLRHTGGLEALVTDCIIRSHEGERPLVVEVPPLAARLLLRLREHGHCRAPTLTPGLSSGYPTLGGLQRAFGRALPPGMNEACAISEGSEGCYTKVYARLVASEGEWLHWRRRCRPTPIRFPTDRDRLGRAFQWATPAHGAAANLRENTNALVQRHAMAILLVAERR